MSFRRFVAHDLVGALMSFVQLIAAGYLLGAAYDSAGIGVAVAGGVVFVIALAVFGRVLARDDEELAADQTA